MGDPGGTDSFTTTHLGVRTGDLGGGFVEATNTTVFYGAPIGHRYTIDGGGRGNTYFDNGGNTGITISPTYHYTS